MENRRVDSLLPSTNNDDKTINFESAETALTDYCTSTVETLSGDSPKKFRKLVNTLNYLDYSQLKQLVDKHGLEGCKIQGKTTVLKDLLFYAILMSGGKGSIQYLTENIKDDTSIEDPTKLATLLSLPFISFPTEETVTSILPFIRNTQSSRLTLFATAFIGNYLRQNNVSANSVDSLKEVVDFIAKKITENYTKKSDSIMYLRSLGNIGYLTETAFDHIMKCVRELPDDEITETFLSTLMKSKSCNNIEIRDKVHDFLKSNLKSKYREPKTSIAAFNAFMTCNSKYTEKQLIDEVFRLMYDHTGEFNHYLRSYFIHLKKSATPEYSELRHALEHATRSYNDPSPITHSRRVGKSYYIKQLNLGVDLVIDYIYDKDGNVPEVINIAVNIPIHEKTVHLFEIGLRLGNEFKVKNLNSLIKLVLKESSKYVTSLIKHNSFKKVDFEQMHTNFIQFLKDANLFSVYIDYNGNTLFYLSTDDLNSNRAKRGTTFFPIITEALFTLVPFTLKANMFYATNLLDVYVETPTITGFLVRKYAQSSALLAVRQMMENFQLGKEAMFSFLPHFAIDINYGIKTMFENEELGMENEYKFGSNFAIKVKQITLNEKNRLYKLELEIKLPNKEMNLLHFSWKKDRIGTTEISSPSKRNSEPIYTSWLKNLIGLVYYDEHKKIIKDGKLKGAIHEFVVKADESITHWKLTFIQTDTDVNLSLKTMSEQRTHKEITYFHRFIVDKDNTRTNISINTEENGLKFNFESIVKPKTILRTEVIKLDNKQNTEMRVFLFESELESGIRVRQSREMKSRYHIATQVGNPQLEKYFAFDANFAKNGFLSIDTSVEYKHKGKNVEKVKLHGKLHNKGVDKTIHHELSGEISFTEWPEYNSNINGKFSLNKQENVVWKIMENELLIKWDKDTNDDKKKIHLFQKYNISIAREHHNIDGYTTLKSGPYDLHE
ncbi:hypothetical protein B4U80_13501, partial [Leptotrombidium deliense]